VSHEDAINRLALSVSPRSMIYRAVQRGAQRSGATRPGQGVGDSHAKERSLRPG
jgi:hypothetical protein